MTWYCIKNKLLKLEKSMIIVYTESMDTRLGKIVEHKLVDQCSETLAAQAFAGGGVITI